MAVARVTADARWFARAAEVLSDFPKANRELLRAVDRRGLTAELNADEARVLAERLPGDERATRMFADVVASEERDRERSSRVRAMMDRHRGRPN